MVQRAVVYEVIRPERCRRRYLWKRALRHSPNERRWFNWANVLKSVLAVAVYTAWLPVTHVLGQHAPMDWRGRDKAMPGRVCGQVTRRTRHMSGEFAS